MTMLLTILGLLALALGLAYALAMYEAPPPVPPPNRLVGRLWAARSIWRERRGPRQ